MICAWMWIKIMKMNHLKKKKSFSFSLSLSLKWYKTKKKQRRQYQRNGSDEVTELHPPQAKKKNQVWNYCWVLSSQREDMGIWYVPQRCNLIWLNLLRFFVVVVWNYLKIHSIPFGFNLDDFCVLFWIGFFLLDYNFYNAFQSLFFRS